jgi:hypothetical protein
MYVLFISQVRSAVIKGLFGIFVTFLIVSWRRPLRVFAWTGALFAFIWTLGFFLSFSDPIYSVAQDRLASLTNIEAIKEARGGAWGNTLYLWENAPLGIGLSRVGAGAAPFKDIIAKDPEYGPDWAFADNLYRAVTTELGIPGLIFYSLLLFGPFFLLAKRLAASKEKRNSLRFLLAGCFGLAAASVLGHPASEGSLYLPECAYYWIFMGAAIKFSDPGFMDLPDAAIQQN